MPHLENRNDCCGLFHSTSQLQTSYSWPSKMTTEDRLLPMTEEGSSSDSDSAFTEGENMGGGPPNLCLPTQPGAGCHKAAPSWICAGSVPSALCFFPYTSTQPSLLTCVQHLQLRHTENGVRHGKDLLSVFGLGMGRNCLRKDCTS